MTHEELYLRLQEIEDVAHGEAGVLVTKLRADIEKLAKPVEVNDELFRKAWDETIDENIPVRARVIWSEGWNALANWMRERMKR